MSLQEWKEGCWGNRVREKHWRKRSGLCRGQKRDSGACRHAEGRFRHSGREE